MRRPVSVLCISLLLLTVPAASAAPPSPGEVIEDAWDEREHCFLILARPYETPQEIVFGTAAVAVCLITG